MVGTKEAGNMGSGQVYASPWRKYFFFRCNTVTRQVINYNQVAGTKAFLYA